jgi:hypothetical protein
MAAPVQFLVNDPLHNIQQLLATMVKDIKKYTLLAVTGPHHLSISEIHRLSASGIHRLPVCGIHRFSSRSR